MIGILFIALIAGLIAGISPCILPVLPVVLVAGTSDGAGSAPGFRRRRSVAVVLGVVVSFSVATLAGTALLSALGLPDTFLRDAGIAILLVVGIGLLVPRVGELLERPFARLTWLQQHRPSGGASGFVLGLGLGLVFVPCAGPVLAAITVAGATSRVSLWVVLVTASFAIGAAVPLLAVALAGDQVVNRTRLLRDRGRWLRSIGGLLLIAMALVIAANLTDGLERVVPGYTDVLQNSVENSAYAHQQLSSLSGEAGASGTLNDCNGESSGDTLMACGQAPAFTGITAWLNTPGDRPLTLSQLRGHVVLVDFWTYSCINCQRTLPHVESWYRRYRRDGLVVVGVHTPEFAFEHVVGNVRTAAGQLGVHYPVAVDDHYATWDAYDNEYWPAEYLIGANGQVRHVHDGEGDYTTTEDLIRKLLVAAHPGLHLPPPTNVPNRTPTEPTNPETYLGYDRLQYLLGTTPVDNRPAQYAFPSSLPSAALGIAGTWTIGAQAMTAGPDARMELSIEAHDVYLVMGGHGTVRAQLGQGPVRTITVAGIPRLYTLVSGSSTVTGTLHLSMSPGVEAYDFTFG